MNAVYQTRVRMRMGPRGLLRVIGVLFLLGAASLYGLSFLGAPSLASLERNRGIVGDVSRHTGGKSAPYLTLSIGGLTYVTRSYRKAWLDSLTAAMRRGDTATAWGSQVPNGWCQLWQLQKGDSMVIAYGERASAEVARNERLRITAMAIGGIAIALLFLSVTLDATSGRRA